MSPDSTRRGFLAACALSPFAGCAALADSEPADVVAGVEWKSISALADDRHRTVADNRPNETVEHRAPVALDLRTVVADGEVLAEAGIEFPPTGPLVVGDARANRLREVYDEVDYALVLTLYERESVAGVPLGNAYGYRLDRAAFDRVNPGDRVVIRVEERDDVARITELVDVTTARDD